MTRKDLIPPSYLKDIDSTYLAHICGYYDFINPPQVLPQTAGEFSLKSVAMHEKAHQWLAEHSVYGLWLIGIRSMMSMEEGVKRIDTLERMVNILVANSIEVQEGFASYVEYISDSTQYSSIDEFKSILLERPPYYSIGFKSASNIDVVFLDPSVPEWTEEQVIFLKRCVLLDICRFSMNVPLSLEQLYSMNNLYENSMQPNTRFKSAMTRLSSDHELRPVFLQKIIPIMEIWLDKYESSFEDPSGKYTGVMYADNCERIIAETFADMPYMHPEDPALGKYWKIDRGQQNAERLEDYLARTECTELKFPVSNPVSFHPGVGADGLLPTLRTHLTCTSRGCYIHFFKPPNLGAKLAIEEGDKTSVVTITSDESIAYFHLADFALNEAGGRIWNYHGGGDGVVFENRYYEEILSVLQHRDTAIVFDANLGLDDPFKPMEWATLGNHVYLISTPMGSIGGLQKILQDQRLGVEGAEIVVIRNWSHFEGAGNVELLLFWFIPRGAEHRVSILYVGTEELSSYLRLAVERNWLPTGFNIVMHPFVVCGEIGRVGWLIGPPYGETLTPALADVVSSHLTDFGW